MSGTLNPRYRTGLCMKGHPHRGVYQTWQNIKNRCLKVNNAKYPRYGGRGIIICAEWLDIQNFYGWALGSGYQPGLSIDRIDNDGNYCPDNCRWISLEENSRKKSTTKLSREQAESIRFKYNKGITHTELAKEYGVTPGNIYHITKGITHVEEGMCTIKLKERNK